MDRILSADTQRRRARRPWVVGGLLLLLLGAGLVAFRGALRPHVAASQLLTARVAVGDVEATLSAGGTVVPGREVAISAPLASTIRRVVRAVGDAVQAGEPLLILDTEQAAGTLGKLRDEQARQQNRVGQLHLTLERALNDLRAQQTAQEARVANLQAALRDEQYLLGVGGTTQENVRQAELNLRVADVELRRLRDQVRTQHRAAAADQREVGFQLASQARDIAEQARRVQQATISADAPGVLTWVNDQLGAAVAQGAEVARVADLRTFRIRATISDSYAAALHPADPVIVRPGPGEAELRGHISTVNPAVDKGSITFYVALDDPQARVLRPNLRVDVFVVTSRQVRTLRVKNGPFYHGGREQVVYVVRPDHRAERRTVRFGEANFEWVQVSGGLRPGEEIILSDTKDFGDAPELIISDN